MDQKTVSKLLEIGSDQRPNDKNDPFTAGPVFIGMNLFLDFRATGKAAIKANAQLVGFIHGKHLIITTPEIDGAHVNFSRAKDIVVRYIIGGSVYGFRTELMHSINKPFHMTFLKYPTMIEHVSLRGAPRIQVVLPFEMDGVSVPDNHMLNISATGALIQVTKTPTVGDIHKITFTLPNGSLIYKIPCIVKRVDITARRTLVGVQFETEHDDFKLVGDYVGVVFDAIRELANPQG